MKKLLQTTYILLFLSSCGSHILSSEEQKQLIVRQTKCENTVSDYIKKHAQFPESYESLAFSDYMEMHGDRNGVWIPDSEDYVIFHKHKLKDLNGEMKIFSGYFHLTYDYEVDIIETKKSDKISAWPPETKIWTSQFGKPLNAQDSLEISQGIEKSTNKTLHDLKESLKNADTKNLNKKNKKLLKSILDTVK